MCIGFWGAQENKHAETMQFAGNFDTSVMQIIPQVPGWNIISLGALFRESRVNTKSPLSNRSTAAEIDLEHCSKMSRLNPCLSVPISRILEASQSVKAIRRFTRGCVSL